MRNQNAMRDREIAMGTAGDDKRTWHAKYKDSAWVYVGGLPYQLTEGDVICVFSQCVVSFACCEKQRSFSGTAKWSTLTWCAIARAASQRASLFYATKTRDQQF